MNKQRDIEDLERLAGLRSLRSKSSKLHLSFSRGLHQQAKPSHRVADKNNLLPVKEISAQHKMRIGSAIQKGKQTFLPSSALLTRLCKFEHHGKRGPIIVFAEINDMEKRENYKILSSYEPPASHFDTKIVHDRKKHAEIPEILSADPPRGDQVPDVRIRRVKKKGYLPDLVKIAHKCEYLKTTIMSSD